MRRGTRTGTGIQNLHPSLRAIGALVLGAMMIAGSPVVEAGELQTNWKLTDLYPDMDAWRAARDEMPKAVEKLQKYRGNLDQGPEKLLAALEIASNLTRQASRIAIYANLMSDLDTRDPGPQGMKQATFQQLAELRAKASWIDPEILSMPAELIQEYLEQEPGLAPYRRTLEKLEMQRQHTLDSDGEQILSLTGLLRGDTANIGSLLLNAELPWQTINLSDGSELKVNVPGYSRGRALANRDDRIKTYEAFYGQLAAFQQVLATTVAATMKSHHFTAKVRHYDDTREASLAGDEVDPAVYDMLVEETNRALPTLHRYLKLRARMLGLDDLAYHDLYPPLVGNVEADYSWPRAVEVVLESFAPMGEEYVEYLRQACKSGWIDVYPREGKRSGAYMSGRAYDVHPYMLLNHLDDYDSASTFAHEAGHMMHSAYSNKTQPFPTSGYETFVAEVASTTQEWLFFKYSLEHATSDDERLVILGNFLESFRTTVFRQTMFAEFELQAHRLVEQGQPVTSESLSALYLDLLKRYHGHDQGVCRIDDAYQVEWAFIPHFHLDYYVYTYATSFIAATACSNQIMTGENGGVERYIDNLLKAGSAKPPVQLLTDAGVDMTTPAPFRAAFAAMNEIIDQIEEILNRQS